MNCGTHVITGGTGKYKGITGSEPYLHAMRCLHWQVLAVTQRWNIPHDTTCKNGQAFRSSSGSSAMLAAMRPASSRVSSLAAARRPGFFLVVAASQREAVLVLKIKQTLLGTWGTCSRLDLRRVWSLGDTCQITLQQQADCRRITAL
jgi:hypothetical protein